MLTIDLEDGNNINVLYRFPRAVTVQFAFYVLASAGLIFFYFGLSQLQGI